MRELSSDPSMYITMEQVLVEKLLFMQKYPFVYTDQDMNNKVIASIWRCADKLAELAQILSTQQKLSEIAS